MGNSLILTGAAGELGRSVLAAALRAEAVDRVIATTRSRAIDAQSDLLTKLTGVDLATEDGSAALADAIDKHPNDHIGLIHCAGSFPPPAPLHKMNLTELSATFASNTASFLGAARAVIPRMRKCRSGGIVAFTSHTQHAAYPFLGSFNMSKMALLSLVQTLANENARFGIGVNAIAVATLQTETERRIKPTGSFKDWVPVEGLADYVINLASQGSNPVSGNEIQYWRYSESFFGESVFARNSIDPRALDSEDG